MHAIFQEDLLELSCPWSLNVGLEPLVLRKKKCLLTKGGWIQLADFLLFFARKKTFVTSCLLSCTSSLFQKVFYSKSKEFAPKGKKNTFERVAPHESGSFPLCV